jgi:hypothetical protein
MVRVKTKFRTIAVSFIVFLTLSTILFAAVPQGVKADVNPTVTYRGSAAFTFSSTSSTISGLHIQAGTIQDVIYVGVFSNGGVSVDYIDSSLGLQWHQRASTQFYIQEDGSYRNLETWYAVCTSATDFDVTIHMTGSGDAAAYAYRITGADPNSPFDRSQAVTTSGYGTNVDAQISTNTPGALAIGFMGVYSSNINFVNGDFHDYFNIYEAGTNDLTVASTLSPTPSTLTFHAYPNAGSHSWGLIVDTISSASSDTPQNGFIKGTVYDQNTGFGISGATVIVTNQFGQTIDSLTTDSSGSYSSPRGYDQNQAPLTVTASATGYQSQTTEQVALISGQIAVHDFSLTIPQLDYDHQDWGASFEVLGGGSIPLKFSTDNQNDLVYISVTEPASATVNQITSTPSLTWTPRINTVYGVNNDERLETWYAIKPQSGSISITLTMSKQNANAAAMAFGISGIDTQNPFEQTPPTNKGSSTTPNVQVSTNNPHDLVIGVLGTKFSNTLGFTLQSGFMCLLPIPQAAYYSDRATHIEYRARPWLLNNENVGYTLTESKDWTMAAEVLTNPAVSNQQYSVDFFVGNNAGDRIPSSTITVNTANGQSFNGKMIDVSTNWGKQTFTHSQFPLTITSASAAGYNALDNPVTINLPTYTQSTAEITLTPIPPHVCTLNIHVLDSYGNPIPQANLNIQSPPDWWIYDQTTDSKGTYTIDLWSNEFPLNIFASKPGCLDQSITVPEPDAKTSLVNVNIVSSPAETYAFTGVVSDIATNKPISGVTVNIHFGNARPDETYITNGNGEYHTTFSTFDTAMDLTLTKDGYLQRQIQIYLGQSDRFEYTTIWTPDHSWTQTFQIKNHLTQQPVPQAILHIRPNDGPETQTVEVDQNGEVTLQFAASQLPIFITVTAPGYEDPEFPWGVDWHYDAFASHADTTIDIYPTTPKTYSVQLDVQNILTKLPIANAQITIENSEGPTYQTQTNAQGQIFYQFDTPNQNPIITITAAAKHYKTEHFQWDFTPSKQLIHVFDMTPTEPIPTVTIDPASGPSGTTITARGENFASKEVVWLNWDNTGNGNIFTTEADGTFEVTYTIPDATIGIHTIYFTSYDPTIGNVATPTFTITPQPPAIHLEPSTVPIGSSYIISGTGFSESNYELSVKLYIDGSLLPTYAYVGGLIINDGSWSSEPITVPFGTSTGTHIITATDEDGFIAYTTLTVTAPESAIVVNPGSVHIGDSYLISGTGFSKTNYEVPVKLYFDGTLLPSFAYVGGLAVNDGSWSSTTFTVPIGTSIGDHIITATDDTGYSASTTITVTPPQTKITLSPSSVPIGYSYTISGKDFSKTNHEVSVKLTIDGTPLGLAYTGGAAVNDGSWRSESFIIPIGTSVGAHTITATDDNGFTASTTLTVTPARSAITANPNPIPAGSSYVISGTGFSKSANEVDISLKLDGTFLGLAYVGGLAVNDGSWSSSTFTIPPSTSLGPHTITATDKNGFTATTTITVTATRSAIYTNPTSVHIGASYIISGKDFSKTNYEVPVTLRLDGAFLGFAYVGGLTINDGSWTSQSYTIPVGTTLGSHTITANDENGFTASTTITITPSTSAITITPTSGPITSSFAIHGTDFYNGESEVAVVIRFDGKQLGLAWTGGFIDGSWTSSTFKVPAGTSVGQHIITATDEEGFTASTTFTVTGHTVARATAKIRSHTLTFDRLSQTGIKTVIDGSSLDEGQLLTVTLANFGTDQPEGTGSQFEVNPQFYDIQVLPTDGTTIGQDVYAEISISNQTFTDGILIYYWNGVNWQLASNQEYDASTHTITCSILALDLQGTPIMVSIPSLFVTPEYPLAGLLALSACLAAFIIFKIKRQPATKYIKI